jgi:hypothetical protein
MCVSQRVTIRIAYRNGLDIVPAERLGTDADGCELYRVWRNPLQPGDSAREDVLRLRPQDGPGFDFIGTADPARPGTSFLTIPSACLATPACDTLRHRLSEHGGVVENEWDSGNALYLAATHPNELPVAEWYEQMLRDAIGITPDEVPEYLFQQRRAKERNQARRKTRNRLTRAASRTTRFVMSVVVGVSVVALVVGVLAGGLTQLIGAGSAERPKVAAAGMLVALVPTLFTRDGRKMWPLFAGCAAAAVGALALLDDPAPSYGAATALGALYALILGAFGVVIGIFSGFSSNARDMGKVVFGIVFPALASAVAAGVLAVTSAAAAGSGGGLGTGVRAVAIGLTALILLAPTGALLLNGGAILFGKAWRRNRALQLSALVTLPLTMVPLMIRVAVPIAILWGVVWLVGRLG